MENGLIQQIRSAFSGIPRPTRITKRVAEAMDDEWVISSERWAELYALDCEQEWTDLVDSDIEEFCSILPWLDEGSMIFYLPAFMCYCLRRFPDEGHRAVCDTLETCADMRRTKSFSPEQMACVRDFTAAYLAKSAD